MSRPGNAFSMNINTSSSSKKIEEGSGFKLTPKQPNQKGRNVFGFNEEEEEAVIIPKGAKLSKPVGKEALPISQWSYDAKQHHLHRPVEKYFSDKEEQQKRIEEEMLRERKKEKSIDCLLYTSPSPRDRQKSRMPSSA
eukprot:TRINITY_DN4514_c0_g1_i3.p2 TRINITY_DN4514_c0_g1~~TRINITY_DN4514_c0_g1_i3.p2  ORF type:complete len:138 (-),score=36.56 TRINITY_DN4514_c0_g1_i3:12-425(-)